ncbi:MAG: hypothetical protein HKN57_07330 [Xanthomonadales bacterium]|nr:fasciclin domain-containing protein [Gammaproteobacteria bacterium]NND57047.1 hypothetical protein [Xanthomonadales bacterium]
MKSNKMVTTIAALTASFFLAGTAVAAGKGKNPGPTSIYDIANTTPGFELLTDLVDVAGLADTLTFDGQFTVFAPTNDAFPFDTVEEGVAFLAGACSVDVNDENLGYIVGVLTNVLLHHVRDGRRFSGSILNGSGPKSLEMLNGYIWVDDDLSIMTGSGGESSINGGLFDVNASNGVIHAITAVMLPKDVCVVPDAG